MHHRTRFKDWIILLLGLLCSAANLVGGKVVLMIGEDEYKTWETLPAFAQSELEPRGHEVTVVHADSKDMHDFPGLAAALADADVLVVSVRRRAPVAAQLEAVRQFLDNGKSVIGIRTASHAFALRPKDPLQTHPKYATWAEFDSAVLGGHYTGHHGAGARTTISVAPGAQDHPILSGVQSKSLQGYGSLYKAGPLAATAEPLLIGSIPGASPEPVAWTHRYGPKNAKVFYTSLGHPDDFKDPEFRKLLVNATQWALAR